MNRSHINRQRTVNTERAATAEEIKDFEQHFEALEIRRQGARFFIKGANVVVRLKKDVNPLISARVAAGMATIVRQLRVVVPDITRDQRTGEIVLTMNTSDLQRT
jgi:hypothetical protein